MLPFGGDKPLSISAFYALKNLFFLVSALTDSICTLNIQIPACWDTNSHKKSKNQEQYRNYLLLCIYFTRSRYWIPLVCGPNIFISIGLLKNMRLLKDGKFCGFVSLDVL